MNVKRLKSRLFVLTTVSLASLVFLCMCSSAEETGKQKSNTEQKYALGNYDSGERDWEEDVDSGVYIEIAVIDDALSVPGSIGELAKAVEGGSYEWFRMVPLDEVEDMVPDWALMEVTLVSEMGCVNSQAVSARIEIDHWMEGRISLFYPKPTKWVGSWNENMNAVIMVYPPLDTGMMGKVPSKPEDMADEYRGDFDEYVSRYVKEMKSWDDYEVLEPMSLGWQQAGNFEGGSIALFYSLLGTEGALGVVEILDRNGDHAYFLRSWEEEISDLEMGYWGAYEPMFAFDVDGDGIDELLVKEFYHEGSGLVLWKVSREGVEVLATGLSYGV